jgi:hypothetical protein
VATGRSRRRGGVADRRARRHGLPGKVLLRLDPGALARSPRRCGRA